MGTLSDENVTQIVMRRRDALGRHLSYGYVRYRIRPIKGARTVTCPCCGYMTLTEEGYDVCTLCSWCDDGQDDFESDRPFNNPSTEVSLTQARIAFRETMTIRPADDKLFALEEALIPLKRELMAVFDMMSGPIDGSAFVQGFNDAHRLMAEIDGRRNEHYRNLSGSRS